MAKHSDKTPLSLASVGIDIGKDVFLLVSDMSFTRMVSTCCIE